MKDLRKAWLPMAALTLGLVFAGCAGEDGKDGKDGARGPTGPAGTAECMQCHTDAWDAADFLLPIQTEFAESKHNTGETYVRRGSVNSPACSGCHTNEGYQIRIATGQPAPVSQSSRIGCFTCHAPHTSKNFALRKTGATELFRGGTYDKGTSNTCVMCHQSLNPSPDFGSTNAITSPYWGGHHGPQANILAGSGAYVFPGATYGTAHPHNGTGVAAGCVHCHMGPTASDGLAGGHSYKMVFEYHGTERANSKPCVACHSSFTDQTAYGAIEGTKEAFLLRLEAIYDTMNQRGWVQKDADGIPRVWTTANGGTPPATADERGAVFNYLMLLEDRSGGIHNPTYAEDVLEATEAFLQGKAAFAAN